MNMKKAIELNKESESSLRNGKFIDHADAIRLGNEAMLLVERYRKSAVQPDSFLLPHETLT